MENITINAIILASGFSRRFGENKLLVEFQGKTLVEHIMDKVLACNFNSISIVAKDREVLDLADKRGINTLLNQNSHLGQSESIKIGLKRSLSADGLMFFVADQPLLDIETIKLLINEFKNNKENIIVPTFNGKKGNPVIFPVKFKDDLLKTEGDTGGRNVIKKHISSVNFVELKDENALKDIDIREDYKKIKDLLEKE